MRIDTVVGVQGALDKVRSLSKSGAVDPQDGVIVLFAPGDFTFHCYTFIFTVTAM